MGTSLKQKILKQLEDDRAKFEEKIRIINDISKELDDITYIVRLHSLWSKEGEQDAEGKSSQLSTAMRNAIANFKLVNNRSDVQANVRVHARFPSHYGYELFLPNKFWETTWNGLKHLHS